MCVRPGAPSETVTRAGETQPEREALGITDGLVRISVGCEEGAGLISDLQSALAVV